MSNICTINTDAGFYPYDKIGSYAFWIKADGLFLRGSGVFKDKCKSPLDAECKAVINALHVLKSSGYRPTRIVFNCDNINVQSKKKGNELEKMIYQLLREIRTNSIGKTHPNYTKYHEFRHVKAHKHTDNPRHWVNDWCDKQCKAELKRYKKEFLSND